MDWKRMKDNTVAMLIPDWSMLKLTAHIVFTVVVPLTALLYIFTSLVWV